MRLDILELEKTAFASEVTDVVLPVYRVAMEKVSDWSQHNQQVFEVAMAEASDETAEIEARGIAAWQDTVLDEQQQAIGSLVLHYLCTALKAGLRDAARSFERSHPRSANGYAGRHWLARVQAEYQERFGIDFNGAPVPFERIEELILARNAGIHWEGDAVREYQEKVAAPRFLKLGSIAISEASLNEALSDAKRFFCWVVDQLLSKRKNIAGSQ